MTGPQPQDTPPAVPGQPTIDAVMGLLAAIVPLLGTLRDIVDPNHGKAAEREAYLKALYDNKDIPGLLAFKARVPTEPKAALQLADNYLNLLGYKP